LFSDIRGFTALVESQGPEETIDLLNTYYMLMFDAIGGHGGVVNQMIGDGLMALFGAPLPLDDCAGSAVAAALEMVELIEQFNHERKAVDKAAIRIGVGVATGDVVAGYTGTQQRELRKPFDCDRSDLLAPGRSIRKHRAARHHHCRSLQSFPLPPAGRGTRRSLRGRRRRGRIWLVRHRNRS
jgi:hypothetical protein